MIKVELIYDQDCPKCRPGATAVAMEEVEIVQQVESGKPRKEQNENEKSNSKCGGQEYEA